jgi:hypothetical protein
MVVAAVSGGGGDPGNPKALARRAAVRSARTHNPLRLNLPFFFSFLFSILLLFFHGMNACFLTLFFHGLGA